MNTDIKRSIKEFEEKRETFLHDFWQMNMDLTKRAGEILKQAMEYNGVDEVLLFLMDPNGEVIDDWCEDENFEYDEKDRVEYDINEVAFGEIEEDYYKTTVPTITRFGLRDGNIVCHRTITVITNMGDTNLESKERDKPDEPWIPISQLGENMKMQNLIIKCVSSPGNWAFTKKHPECRFLHRIEAIDLSLPSGTKWCNCNVGASSPEDYGGYFAWGETSERSEYTRENYAFYDNEKDEYINIGEDISGTEYDVAHVRMGAGWRMPTREQQQELIDHCTWKRTLLNGVLGYLVTGPNEGRIFLPLAGYLWNDDLDDEVSKGCYWSSSFDDGAYNLSLDSRGLYLSSSYPFAGFNVRAVCP